MTEMKTQLPEATDLRGITRRPDRCRTTVSLLDQYERRHLDGLGTEQVLRAVDWLVVGEAQLYRQETTPVWMLKAHLADGATDNEHDLAYALQLPLIGVELRNVHYQITTLRAWVQPQLDYDDHLNFRVPRPGYDPARHPGAKICRECEKKHPIVPYMPEYDPQLHRLVAGRRVEIEMGPTTIEED
jgi:hypothetical protein